MTTEEAFRDLIFNKKDAVKRTSMTLCDRSKFRAILDGRIKGTMPKRMTMEGYLQEYGYTMIPERWECVTNPSK